MHGASVPVARAQAPHTRITTNTAFGPKICGPQW